MTCYSGCSASTQLKTATVRVTTLNATDAYGGQAIGSTRINGNAWRGDSGGPQFYNGQQVGVASTADGASRQYYGSVPNNRAWIQSVAGVCGFPPQVSGAGGPPLRPRRAAPALLPRPVALRRSWAYRRELTSARPDLRTARRRTP